MHLHEIKSPLGSRKRRKIVGRGQGSGHGRTSCRGEKGQKSRGTGHLFVRGFEGGQSCLIRRLPKVGFRSHRPVLHQVVNLERLNAFENGTVVDASFLKAQGLIESLQRPFKILGDGEIKKTFVIRGGAVSKTARDKIIKAGGRIEAMAEKFQK